MNTGLKDRGRNMKTSEDREEESFRALLRIVSVLLPSYLPPSLFFLIRGGDQTYEQIVFEKARVARPRDEWALFKKIH